MKTVLITGCSSGFGLEIAKFFLHKGWQVVATMRTARQDLLPPSENLTVLPLDVTDAASIMTALEAAGPIDVLVNNAGIGWMNAVEGTSLDIANDLFQTNVIGLIALTQAVLPQFRQRRAGVIVNISSSVTLKPLPLLSVYSASKAAVNAFTESAALELAAFDIRVRAVLPGRAPDTQFGATARNRIQQEGGFPQAYTSLVADVFASWQHDNAETTQVEDVTAAVWYAATDPASPILIPAGADAVALAA